MGAEDSSGRSGSIEFTCKCGKRFRVGSESVAQMTLGKVEILCLGCGGVVGLPEGPINFTCKCGKRFTAPSQLVAKMTLGELELRCPACGDVVRVPGKENEIPIPPRSQAKPEQGLPIQTRWGIALTGIMVLVIGGGAFYWFRASAIPGGHAASQNAVTVPRSPGEPQTSGKNHDQPQIHQQAALEPTKALERKNVELAVATQTTAVAGTGDDTSCWWFLVALISIPVGITILERIVEGIVEAFREDAIRTKADMLVGPQSCPRCGESASPVGISPGRKAVKHRCAWCGKRFVVRTDHTQPVHRERQPIPERVRHEVWRRDSGKCVNCGSSDQLEFDHIVPVSKGGSNTARNVQLLCAVCNRKKAANI